MQISDTFKVSARRRTAAEALALADDIERAVGDLISGKLKPGRLDVGLLTGAVQALRDHISTEPSSVTTLVAQHSRLIEEGNDYAYFELAYTRQTGWMAWITDKPLYGAQPVNLDRKVLFNGTGSTPEDACRNALLP